MNQKWMEKQIRHARDKFKNFRADFKDYGDLQTLEWRDRSGSSHYHIHYIFDIKQQHMHVSGDLGSACFCLTWEPTFANMCNVIRDPQYITGKIECSTDKFVYPEEYVRAEVEEYYKDSEPKQYDYNDCEQYLEELEEFKETIESIISSHDYYKGFQSGACEKMEEVESLDPEWYEHNFGQCISTRVYCWLVGLQMAWEQVNRPAP